MPLRCVLVDDSEPFLQSARRLLEREGVRVVAVACTAADAVERVGRLEPDVALVDIDLAWESGLELARRIAKDPELRHTRVVLISGHARSDYADLIDASPAAGFVAKSSLTAAAVRAALS